MGGVNWTQFAALLTAIRKGEQSADDVLGLEGDGGGNRAARLAGAVVSFVVIAGLMFLGGLLLGDAGASVLSGFNITVVTLALLSLTMGFYTAVSSLFLVSDLSFYVALPISGQTILWAKLAGYFSNAVLMDAAVLPLGLGLLLGRGEGPLAWVLMVVAFVLCALAVNVAMVLLVLPLMRFSKVAVDKDRFSRALGALITLLVVAVSVAISIGKQTVGDGGLDVGAVASLTEGVAGMPVVKVILTVLCPPFALGGAVFDVPGAAGLVGLVGMAALLAAYALLLDWCAGKWYFEAVRGLAGGAGVRSSKRYGAAELGAKVSGRSQFKAFVAVDVASLVRVPYFFNQFVLSQWLAPLILLVVSGFSLLRGGDVTSFDQLREVAGSCELGATMGLVPLAISMLLAVFTGIQSYACGQAVSRDGQDFFFFRAMPVDLRAYAKAKFVANELVGRVPVVVVLFVGMLAVGLPPLTALACIVIYALSVACADLASLSVGMQSPKLDWESESELVKGNEAFGSIVACVVVTVLVMVLPALCLAAPIVLELEVGPWGSVAAVAVCALELAGLAALAFGSRARKLATIEP